MIVRMDDSGLGNQTRNLAYMLKPSRLLIINSKSFNGRDQHPEWYDGWEDKIETDGFPSKKHMNDFLEGMDVILTCEIPYGYDLFTFADMKGVRTYLQYNYEFLDYLLHPNLPKPTMLIAPSEWCLDQVYGVTQMFPTLLRPPIFLNDFKKAREINVSRDASGTKKLLHVVGSGAIHDRNGTKSVIEAAEKSMANFTLTIKSQVPIEPMSNNPKIIYSVSNVKDSSELYEDFDAMILPRRYGGLCLPMNEAMASALPVFMTDIEPNKSILPKDWLVKSQKVSEFTSRANIDIFGVYTEKLIQKIDWFCSLNNDKIQNMKNFAFDIAYNEFSHTTLVDRYKMEMGIYETN